MGMRMNLEKKGRRRSSRGNLNFKQEGVRASRGMSWRESSRPQSLCRLLPDAHLISSEEHRFITLVHTFALLQAISPQCKAQRYGEGEED